LQQDGGVKKKILKSGAGPKPTEFAECEIQYIGYFTNGKVFANTYREYEVVKKKKKMMLFRFMALSCRKR
jgi:FKBP-type peptidyl-prolyl cis-trans isomerase